MSQLDRLRASVPEPRRRHPNRLPTPLADAPVAGSAQAASAHTTGGDEHLSILIAVLDSMDATYLLEDDGVSGAWENGLFHFRALSDSEGAIEVFQVSGAWVRVLPVDLYADAVEFANDWNSEHVWPKVFVRPEASGSLGIYAEVSADLSAGSAPGMISTAVQTGIVAALVVFDEAEAAFPRASSAAAAADPL